MALIVKIQSQASYTHEKNNFVTMADKTVPNSEAYHTMMDFMKACPLSYAMCAAPVIYYEVVEEIWSTAVYDDDDVTLTFNLKGKECFVDAECLMACLRLPKNNVQSPHKDEDVVAMLETIGYTLDTSSLGAIKKRGLRKEWNYLVDSFIKVFSGKVSNFDVITYRILDMFYMFVNN